jgi:hypothetical protein
MDGQLVANEPQHKYVAAAGSVPSDELGPPAGPNERRCNVDIRCRFGSSSGRARLSLARERNL